MAEQMDQSQRPDQTPARARALAFYLPQFHPVEENDRWWGRGFTEWTNVASARPLYRGHWQPRLPADLGFYDLRIPEVRESQARLARAHGIEGFVYWHYWFGGRRILELPLRKVKELGEPDFPFMLGWANQSWTGIWHGAPNRTLIEQTYPGDDDHRAHFAAIEPLLHDPRYIRVRGCPAFYVYDPGDLPDRAPTMDLWRELARRSGLPGLYFIGQTTRPGVVWPEFDATVPSLLREGRPVHRIRRALRRAVGRGRPMVYNWRRDWMRSIPAGILADHIHPCVVANWDNTPRSGVLGRVFEGTTPALLRTQLEHVLERIEHKPLDHRLLFLKSWNEWAEGNYLEPDVRFGDGWLRAVRDALLVGPGRTDGSMWYVNAHSAQSGVRASS